MNMSGRDFATKMRMLLRLHLEERVKAKKIRAQGEEAFGWARGHPHGVVRRRTGNSPKIASLKARPDLSQGAIAAGGRLSLFSRCVKF